MHQRRRVVMVVTVVAVGVLAACGGGGDDDQDDVADVFMSVADDEGIELDEACLDDVTSDLDASDAEAIVEAGIAGEPDVSDEGRAIAQRVFTECVDLASYVDSIVTVFTEQDPTIDGDCLRTELDGSSLEQIDDQIVDAALACSGDGDGDDG